MGERLEHNTDADRYELYVDDELAGIAEYRTDGDILDMVHTGVDPSMGGKGIGSRLVGGALADIQAHNQRIRPYCTFVSAYVQRHPEFLPLVVDPAQFGLYPWAPQG